MKMDFEYIDTIKEYEIEEIKTKTDKSFFVKKLVIMTNREIYTILLKSMEKDHLIFIKQIEK
jgi:hypothetical protein